MSMDLAWQPSLFDGPGVTVRPHADFAGLRRHELGAGAWVDVAPRWCDGADALFARGQSWLIEHASTLRVTVSLGLGVAFVADALVRLFF